MITTLEVKNGTIKLPTHLKRRLDNKKVILNESENLISIVLKDQDEIPDLKIIHI